LSGESAAAFSPENVKGKVTREAKKTMGSGVLVELLLPEGGKAR
jgi:hypothetical protein